MKWSSQPSVTSYFWVKHNMPRCTCTQFCIRCICNCMMYSSLNANYIRLHRPFIKLPHEFNMTIRCSINNAIHKRVTQIDLLAGPVTSDVCVCIFLSLCPCVCTFEIRGRSLSYIYISVFSGRFVPGILRLAWSPFAHTHTIDYQSVCKSNKG